MKSAKNLLRLIAPDFLKVSGAPLKSTFISSLKWIGFLVLGGMALVLFSVMHFQGMVSLPDSEVLVQSQESKTSEGGSVYNAIKFMPGKTQDVWMMNQLHKTKDALPGPHSWDRLAIVIDKSRTPFEARFLQLPPGELQWNEQLLSQGQPYRVSCFLCHSNGPRVIRPDSRYSLNLLSKAKVGFWNLRIKSYGRIVEAPVHALEDAKLAIPFRHRAPIDNDELNVASCTGCHQEKGFFRRGFLKRQNALAIRFMIKNKLMPPPGFALDPNDKIKIDEFLAGF